MAARAVALSLPGPAATATWSSRSTSCLADRTKSPGVRPVASTVSSGRPWAQACAFQAKPMSGWRRNDSPWSCSVSASSPQTLTMAASASRTRPPGSRGGLASSGRRPSKVSADRQAASSAGVSASHRPRRRHSDASRSSSVYRLASLVPSAVTCSPSRYPSSVKTPHTWSKVRAMTWVRPATLRSSVCACGWSGRHRRSSAGSPGVLVAIRAAVAGMLAQPLAECGDLAVRTVRTVRTVTAVSAAGPALRARAVAAEISARQPVAHGRGEVPSVIGRPLAEGRGDPDPLDGIDRDREILQGQLLDLAVRGENERQRLVLAPRERVEYDRHPGPPAAGNPDDVAAAKLPQGADGLGPPAH